MELVSVAAVAANGVIGRDGEIPWRSRSEDKRQYRARVADAPVILGRRTFESMRDDLPGRTQIVLSRTEGTTDVDSAAYAVSAEEAIEMAAATGADTSYVLGGAEIYRLFQPSLDRMLLSRIPDEYEGDAYYPEWAPEDWKLVRETPFEGFTLEEWERVRSETGSRDR